MKKSIYQKILQNCSEKRRMIAVLLDPDKCVGGVLEKIKNELKNVTPDFIFIGGSTQQSGTENLIAELADFSIHKILFPGDVTQFSPKADAILFLSLLSGKNPEYLIGQHSKSSVEIKKSLIEVIPTAYLLIDGGKISAVRRLSKTEPIRANDIEKAVSIAVAGELLGLKTVYLEAGSGALNPVSTEMISAVKKEIEIPLIVGGGIRTENQLKTALKSGADIIVVGNLFETNPEMMRNFVEIVQKWN